MTAHDHAYELGGYLGEILIREAGLRHEHLVKALERQKEDGGRLGEILVRMRFIDEEALIKALAVQFELPWTDKLPEPDEFDPELIEKLPINFAKQHLILPYARDDRGRVLVAMAEPLAVHILDDVRMLLDAPCDGVLTSGAKVLESINKIYSKLREGAELADEDDDDEYADAEELVDILDLTDEAPIMRWVNSLMFQAVKERASDIHIEPGEKDITVRFRIDGRLRENKHANRQYLASIVARVKIMAGLDIAEKRLPQDGRIRRKIAGKDVDMRVATAPTATGERVTIRLLDRSSVLLGLGDIGMAGDTLQQVRHIIQRPHGILLVTGPTGSGKTTTLYGCLSEINAPDKNILTIEDPVEYQLEGISQTQVNPKIDLSFASGMRSFLRHDPDVIMVGEIRDRETAEIAITASLTGHFVFSTVHTNDAAGAVTRLVDMGIEPFLVASSLVGLLAQRLVRTPCRECAQVVRPSEEAVRELGLDPVRFFNGDYEIPEVHGARPLATGTVLRAVGCPSCLGVGYTGRTGLYELLLVNDEVRQLTLQKADAGAVRKAGIAGGMVSLRMDGARKVMAGATTPEEVLLVTAENED
jgi:general secretion pathway protein E